MVIYSPTIARQHVEIAIFVVVVVIVVVVGVVVVVVVLPPLEYV